MTTQQIVENKIQALVAPTAEQVSAIEAVAAPYLDTFTLDVNAIAQGFITPQYVCLKAVVFMGIEATIDDVIFATTEGKAEIASVSSLLQAVVDKKMDGRVAAANILNLHGLVKGGHAVGITQEEVATFPLIPVSVVPQMQQPVVETVVETAQADNTNTNNENGGVQMNQQIVVTPEVIEASIKAGTMTLEQGMQLMAAQQQAQQPVAGNVVVGGANTVANLVGTTANAAGQIVTGGVTAVTDLIAQLAGVGAQAMGTVANTANGMDIKGKLQAGANVTLDTTHTVVGGAINATTTLASSTVKVGAVVGVTAVDTLATVSKQLITAGEEIANVLIGAANITAHSVNDGLYFTGKKIVDGKACDYTTEDIHKMNDNINNSINAKLEAIRAAKASK